MPKKFLRIPILLLTLVLLLSGCRTANSGYRSYVISQKLKETTANDFFEWTVHSIEVEYGELGGYLPEDGTKYVIADITVKNIRNESIPVGIYDYEIYWGSTNEESAYPYSVFFDEMFPDDTTLPVKQSVSGLLVFEVPTDTRDVRIVYKEIYNDDTRGNVYQLKATIA